MKKIDHSKIFSPKKLVIVLGSLLYVHAVSANDSYKQIGDLEIYRSPSESGHVTVMMLLDNSTSMKGQSSITEDYRYNVQCTIMRGGNRIPLSQVKQDSHELTVKKDDGSDGDKVKFNRTYCPSRGGGGPNRYDRISRLKMAMIGLLADPVKYYGDNYQNISMGLGYFHGQWGSSGITGGQIAYPAKKLTYQNRLNMIKVINDMQLIIDTPTAKAYAQAGAYMLGTNTDTGNKRGFYLSAQESKHQNNYISPAVQGQCDGYGIYFLTDGIPNPGGDVVLDMMNQSLGSSNNKLSMNWKKYSQYEQKDCVGDPVLAGLPKEGVKWGCIGEYAKLLRRSDNNINAPILTGVVGFGNTFETAHSAGKKQIDYTNPITQETKKISVIDCEKMQADHRAYNMCKWGNKGRGYGEGGFYYAQTPKDIADSLTDFTSTVLESISYAPAGTISVPSDPLSVSSLQPYAYLPMLKPDAGSDVSIWQGNLKKYHTLYGTLYGKNQEPLYIKDRNNRPATRDFPTAMNPKAMDIWQIKQADNSANLNVGGTREHISDKRSVYLEVKKDGKPALVLVSVDNGTVKGLDNLTGYSIVDKAYVLNYLGYPVKTNISTSQELMTEFNKVKDNPKKRVLGGVLHSPPVLAAYGGSIDSTTGNITTEENARNDYLLYGSMDGALHMVDGKNGKEKFAFIPREKFDNTDKREALVSGSVRSDGRTGQPEFGIDAPWTTTATYTMKDNGMQATKMFAYGGMRMGGVGFYGLDISNKDAPKMLFSIDDKTSGFERLGQTWSKPLEVTVRIGDKNKKALVLGGGYDMRYENPSFKLGQNENAKGNAVYMIDAQSGALIAHWTAPMGSGVNSVSDHRRYMNHSIVSEIVGLDRNNNGVVDSLYFADLGGQIFRIDLKEGANKSDMTRRVVRVFNANGGNNSDLPYRFYEKPQVSFYMNGGERVAMVNISSGDRSSPIHKRRSLSNPNRVYGILDRDLATANITSSKSADQMRTKNLTELDFHRYDVAIIATMNDTGRKNLIDQLKAGNKQGWYYPMVNFDGFSKVSHLKSIGSSLVTGSIYYTSIYSPEFSFKNSTCELVIGATERQLYCLPWGICADHSGKLTKNSKNGVLGYMRAGPGIQELTLTTVTNQEGKSTSFRTIVGQQKISDRIIPPVSIHDKGAMTGATGVDAMVTNPGQGANVPIGDNLIVDVGHVLKVQRWYDLQEAEDNQ